MPSKTSTDIHKSFQQDGFVGPLDILTAQEAHDALLEVQNELSNLNASRFKLHLILPSISRIAHHPTLVEAVKSALACDDILLWSSDINIKEPKSAGFYAPHQDATYAGLFPSSGVLTAWVALSHPVGEREGCLSFYPASHKLRQLPHFNETNGDNLLVLGQYIGDDVVQTLNKPIPIELTAGQATLHSFDCVHASAPNRSDNPRVGLALRYMTANVIQTKPVREMVTLICGDRDSRTLPFDFEPRLPDCPSLNDIRRGREVHADALRKESSNYFNNDDTNNFVTRANLHAEPILCVLPSIEDIQTGREAQKSIREISNKLVWRRIKNINVINNFSDCARVTNDIIL
ncbi:hypothetical protein HJC23_010478 [Cyclotella cryptica]|uniref:Phytanoyl-CoA dioxygenase n=1 Tax=Cyclotella cryptica TaxID=29204 RepID=A0ABD3QAE0_9STRA|eukprot:CCRYP_007050-RA/>CCRYP_007050-RA protein AED:0.13 eAED:0.13 QI:108/-1/1/1/-1/1/1/23/346